MARDIAEIRRDIEHSRARLRDTAEAIGWKADVPARARDILRETAGVVRERVAQGHSAGSGDGHGGGPSGPGLLERAKSAVGGVTGGVSSATSTVADKAGSARDSVSSTASTVGEKVGSAASTVGDTVGSAKESAASTASTMGDRVSSARESVSSGAGSASETAGSAVGTVKDHMPSTGDARQGVRQVAGVAKANPMALAVGALVLGAAAGIALPRTRVEEETVAPVAEDLKEQGVAKATQAVRQGGEVVTEKASEMADQGRQAVGRATEQARERVSDTADRAATAGEPTRSVS